MTVWIHVKKLGRKVREIGTRPFELAQAPETLRGLIAMLARREVEAFRRRHESGEPHKALSEAELLDLGESGKIAFGNAYGPGKADPETAVDTAVQAFEDGLVRFFINDTKITALDAPLTLRDGDTITIIRLTMLSGGFF